MRIGFTVLLLCSMAAGITAAETLDGVLSHLDRAGSQFKGMSANFKNVKHTAVVPNDDSVSTGSIKIKRPQPHDMRMLVDFVAPDKKVVAFEGHLVDIYLPKIKTVQEYDVGKNKDLLEQFFLVGFGTTRHDLEAAYNVSLIGPEPVAGEPADRIALVSKSPDVVKHLTKFELWISNKTGQPVQQKFYEPSGDWNVFIYSDMKLNPNLKDSALKLQYPADTKKEYPK